MRPSLVEVGTPLPKRSNVYRPMLHRPWTVGCGKFLTLHFARASQAVKFGTERLLSDTGQATALNLKIDANDRPVDEIEVALSAFGVIMPSGSKV